MQTLSGSFNRYKALFLLILGCHPVLPLQSLSAQMVTDLSTPERLFLHDRWTFRSTQDTLWRPAQVPGAVHTDLLYNGVIEDPYYRTNEAAQQWIDKEDWEYRLRFEMPESWMQKECIDLQFNGLDTYADVYLNDSLLFRADNFFIAWRVSVKKHLQPGTNELRVLFHSPTRIGLEKLAANGFGLPAVNDQSENGGLGNQKVSVFTRKPGYHYGWDWGPRLVTSGIWRPVFLEAWDQARLQDVFFQQEELNQDLARLKGLLTIESANSAKGKVLVYAGETLLNAQEVDLAPGLNHPRIDLQIDQPKWWWTHDLGEPHLYHLRTVLQVNGHSIDTLDRRIGLRTIRVVQEPDEKGSSFYFELNGVPVFAKGANYIPNDIFIPRVSESEYRRVVSSAVHANMNMLRVWGGGFYEEDLFYDLCDEMGIMVWQDFMFACSMYPGNEEFLNQVRQEAEYNVRRLRHHPSIALWCGNNEIDVAWAQYQYFKGWGWKQRYNAAQRTEIWAAYEKIFHQLLPAAVDTLSPGIFYWPSSPYARLGEHATSTSTSGDIHYWGVWHGKEPFFAFYQNIGRFMSEYGFQSFPEFSAVQQYTLPQDWDIESEVMAAHQRSGIGNLRIRSYMRDHYRVPGKFEDQLYVGQLLQAEGIKTAIEAHRSAKPYCMGTLYWQLNDCWPVASWSSMDYYQNWKALQYFVKKAYAPVMLAFRWDKKQLTLRGISDLKVPVDATLQLEVIDFSGKTHWKETRPVQLAADESKLLIDYPERSLRNKGGARRSFLRARLVGEEGQIASAVHYFVPPKRMKLPKAKFSRRQVEQLPDGSLKITLQSDHLVKNVYLRFPALPGFFSDNYFDLLPGEGVEIIFEPKAGIEPAADSHLVIKSLRDTY